jgi:hypothetical protein
LCNIIGDAAYFPENEKTNIGSFSVEIFYRDSKNHQKRKKQKNIPQGPVPRAVFF